MTPLSRLRSLPWSYCAFIAAASITTVRSALHAPGSDPHGAHGLHGPHAPHLVLALAVTETLAALTLLTESVDRIACAVLLLVYGIAIVISLLSASPEAVLRLAFYAVTASYIVRTSQAGTTAQR
jgi:hypothetical protein